MEEVPCTRWDLRWNTSASPFLLTLLGQASAMTLLGDVTID